MRFAFGEFPSLPQAEALELARLLAASDESWNIASIKLARRISQAAHTAQDVADVDDLDVVDLWQIAGVFRDRPEVLQARSLADPFARLNAAVRTELGVDATSAKRY